MLTLLSPAGLWALAALSLPLALHLWRRPPQTVRLGSLRFLERLTRHRPRDLRWQERLLLAVRLLLLALLALMLARPHWRPASWNRPQHWVLLDPDAALDDGSLDRLRALQQSGYETHQLTAGFPKGSDVPSRVVVRFEPAPDLWSLLREADAALPASSSLVVFTPGRLASLRGDRPVLSRVRVEWVMTRDRATVAKPPPPPATPQPALDVLVLHDAERTADATYLGGAVRAVAQVSGRDIRLTERSTTDFEAGDFHGAWAFWLSNAPPPEILAAGAANLVTDAEGEATLVDTAPGWIVSQPGVAGAEALRNPVRLWRRLPAANIAGETILWTDGFGRPLLTRSGAGSHFQWRFYSRFVPEWTDLPRTTALPAWLRGILLPKTNPTIFADAAADIRHADPAQLPATMAPLHTAVASLPLRHDTTGLQGWFWLGAAILCGVERWLSHRRAVASPVSTNAQLSRVEPELAR